MNDLLDLGQEFLRWEIATATVGSVLGINPFDRPNVQESKNNTNRLLKQVEEGVSLHPENPALMDEPLHFFSKAKMLSAGWLLSSKQCNRLFDILFVVKSILRPSNILNR